MHIQTHILSGWCFGNLFKLTSKERFFCMLAAGISDVDGFGYFISKELYWDYHHLFAHNIFFIVLSSLVLTFFSKHKIKSFMIFLCLMHIHLIMDYFGSGYGWQIKYFWPISQWGIWDQNAWPFFGWQNKVAGIIFILWTLAIIVIQKHTFFEWPMPLLDRQIVTLSERMKNKINSIRR